VNSLIRRREQVDFKKFGYETGLECGDDEKRALTICSVRIHSLADETQPELTRLHSEIEQNQDRGKALHAQLYSRPEPVNDAAMLTHARKVRRLRTMTVLAALACTAGNNTTFYLFGFDPFMTAFLALAATVVPLVVGDPAYEHIVAKHRKLRNAIIMVAVALAFTGLLCLGYARWQMTHKVASSAPAPNSHVDDDPTETPVEQEPKAPDVTQADVNETFGWAVLFIMIAADLMLGYMVGRLGHLNHDEDYAAWRKLHETKELITKLEENVSQLHAYIEIAKKRCAEGILRAQNTRNNRKPPYHGTFALLLFIVLAGGIARAQAVAHEEGILIDVSGSIGRAGGTSELFREYLTSTRKLLLSEPAKSRVWVSSISSESFGGVREVVKGWTPEARGIFTDDLDRARHQVATSFAKNVSGMSAASAGTDIFGGLWRMKTLFESGSASGDSGVSKTIFIFSDMVNETKEFQIPAILPSGPEKMLEQARANGLLVPLKGYQIYIYGASPNGLTPQGWLTVKNFWTMYFEAAGAELVSYSAECDVQR
jgi:hypothetical protein